MVVNRVGSFRGSLQEKFGGPLANQVVELLVDGILMSSAPTAEDGTFSIEYRFLDPGSLAVTARFPGTQLYLPSQAQSQFPVVTVNVEADIPPTLVRGETATISGKLTLAERPWPEERVILLWDEKQIAEIRSKGDGTFSHSIGVDGTESLGIHRLIVSVPSFQEGREVEVAVKARTFLSVAGPLEGRPQEDLTYEVTLRDDREAPIPQAAVTIDGQPVAGNTDETGAVALSLHVPEHAERLSPAFRFEETEMYLGSVAVLGIGVLHSGGGRPWLWLPAVLVPMIALALGGGIYIWFRRRHGPTGPTAHPSPPPSPEGEAAAVKPVEGGRRRSALIYIELPQIAMPVPHRVLEVSFDGDQRNKETDPDGLCSISHTFHRKGVSTIAIRLRKDTEFRESSKELSLRIVDYREEVVRLFNDALQSLRKRGVNLSPDTSPREMERLVSQQWDRSSRDPIEQVVECFEEADYSMHTIIRDHFVRMYLAYRQLTERGGVGIEATA